MSSKKIIALILAALSLLALAACGGKQSQSVQAPPQWTYPIPEPDYNAKLSLDFSPFEEAMASLTDARRAELDQFLADANVGDIQDKLDDGSLTSEELTIYYLDRIQRYDVDNFNSVLALNPDALKDAQALDAERASGKKRGYLHGVPVLLKNNIAIQGMTTAAGAVVMQDWKPAQDAAVTAVLRQSGAVILGHANLSEWANWMDPGMPNGFSALGGQTRNPYGPYDTMGSSSGSAVAAAANFAAVTVGTETQGSLLAPATYNSVVGIKPTHGLVSGEGVIPLLPFQDDAGPMARNVIDAAALLTAMRSPDPNNAEANAHADDDYLAALSPDAIKTVRLGMTSKDDALQAALEKLGVQVVLIDAKDVPPIDQGAFTFLQGGFKYAIGDFLSSVDAPVKSLDDIIAFNEEDMQNRAPYGQKYLLTSQQGDWSREKYEKERDQRIQTAQKTLTDIFDQYNVDVILDSANILGQPLGQVYAAAGWPAMVIPGGYDTQTGQPVSYGFVARPFQETKLLSAGVAVELLTKVHKNPDLNATIQMLDEKLGDKK